MAKIKLTKGELKRQRDSLRRFERYLPILQLKKQQLQMEILRETKVLGSLKSNELARERAAQTWAGLLSDKTIDLKGWIRPSSVNTAQKNIAGVDVPLFKGAEFAEARYDMFTSPLWVDAAIDALRELVSLRAEIDTAQRSLSILRAELRVTTQRVNLFEKVKIPEAEEIIRRIKIYIGDQMANAVGRSKIAKRKIEIPGLAGAPA